MKETRLVNRVLLYLLGLLLLSIGVVISVNSNLGISPVNSLPYVLSLVTELPMGNWVTLCFLLYILLQIVLLRRDFRWINLAQIVFSTIFGYMVDAARLVLGSFVLPGYPGRLVMLAISIVFIAAGLTFVIGVGLIPMPSEGLALAIAQKFPKLPFHKAKSALDCSIVAVSITLSLLLLGGLYGVREGTVLSAIFIGRVIPYVKKPLQPIIDRLCFPSNA